MSDAVDLIQHARDTHVVVVGGGVSGLVAALECAKVGIRVTVLESTDRLGGVVRSAELDGLVLDVGAESFATRGGTVRALIDELGLGDAVVLPSAAGAWVAGLPGGKAAPLPTGGVLGIPANPWADDVRRVIGWGGAWRAYLDRLRPPLTIGHQRSLGKLVRGRMGDRVLDRLVAPVTSGVYSALPDDIDVDLAAPGLNSALTRTGSLAGAVGQLRGAGAGGSARPVAPGSAVAGLDGGMTRLVDALRERLVDLGAEILTDARVESIDRGASGGWHVGVHVAASDAAGSDAAGHGSPAPDAAAPDAMTRYRVDETIPPARTNDVGSFPEYRLADAAGPDAATRHPADDQTAPARPDDIGAHPEPRVADAANPRALRADAVIVATTEAEARRLLADVVPALAAGSVDAAPAAPASPAPPAPVVEVITLVVDAPALDAHPRGTGVLAVPGSSAAKALTHSTAKWAWLAAATPHHVLRVSFGAQGELPATQGLDDGDAAALALSEASALLGVALEPARLRASHRERYVQSQPAATIGRADVVSAARTAIHSVEGLAATGAWLAGTGLAQVVPDAIAEAERVRRGALWGSDAVTD